MRRYGYCFIGLAELFSIEIHVINLKTISFYCQIISKAVMFPIKSPYIFKELVPNLFLSHIFNVMSDKVSYI